MNGQTLLAIRQSFPFDQYGFYTLFLLFFVRFPFILLRFLLFLLLLFLFLKLLLETEFILSKIGALPGLPGKIERIDILLTGSGIGVGSQAVAVAEPQHLLAPGNPSGP